MKKNVTRIMGLMLSLPLLGLNIINPAPGLFVSYGDQNTVAGLALIFINLLLGIVGILSVLFIIIGGFQYISSGGNEEQAEAGKKTLTNAIIGLVITILAYVIVVVIINALKGNV